MSLELLRPRWLALHVGIAALVVLMVNLGFWQLRRLDEKRAFNASFTAMVDQQPVDLGQVAPGPGSEWRPVVVTGTYLAGESVTVVNRSQRGAAGVMSVVPLRTTSVGIILVNRGFVPLGTAVPAAPTGAVTVRGYLRSAQARSGVTPSDSTDPANTEFQRYDIALIGRSIDTSVRDGATVYPMYLQLVDENPDDGTALPDPATLPELDEGPHLSYAVQWYFFSLCAVGGWTVVVSRKVRELRGRSPARASS